MSPPTTTLSSLEKLNRVLPTGTVFLYQLLSLVLTNNGRCSETIYKYLIATLVGMCGLSFFITVGANTNNGNNTTRNWIILLNIINVKKEIIQHYLDWGAALALFKEIQALGWLNFVTGADRPWLVSPRIQQPNKCRMARTTSTQCVQAQSSTRKNTLSCQYPLYFLCVLYVAVTWIGSEWVYL